MSELPFRARAFGLDWAADLRLTNFDDAAASSSPADFEVRRIEVLPERNVVAHKRRGDICVDGFQFGWPDIVTFDVQLPKQIGYLPLQGWRGAMPDAFFSTVTALTMAGRGNLSFHASAIEHDGRAYLFAGQTGAGKSTLTAELLANGARLLSDDLTIVVPPEGSLGFRIPRGRPSMRLHPATAALIDYTPSDHVPEDPRGKLLVCPRARAADAECPLGGIFLLGPGTSDVPPAEAQRLLLSHLFRPRWMARLPGHGNRRAALIDLASRVPIRRLPAIDGFDAAARRLRIHRVVAEMAG